jgi:hypothetical protein
MGESMYRSICSWTSALIGGEWSASRPGRFITGERASDTHWIGGWVDPRTGLDDVERRKFLLLPGLEFRPLDRPSSSQLLYRLRYPGRQPFCSFTLRSLNDICIIFEDTLSQTILSSSHWSRYHGIRSHGSHIDIIYGYVRRKIDKAEEKWRKKEKETVDDGDDDLCYIVTVLFVKILPKRSR